MQLMQLDTEADHLLGTCVTPSVTVHSRISKLQAGAPITVYVGYVDTCFH